MRLLDASTLEVVEVRDDDVPDYAILSHTWGRDEVSLQDLELLAINRPSPADSPDQARTKDQVRAGLERKSGFTKISQASLMSKEYGYEYVWIDTCCIDKTSSAELSEAINSMFSWYQAAGVCFAFLRDVQPLAVQDPADLPSSFRASRWFTRGWTLQELIAPQNMIFFARDWTYLGRKYDEPFCRLLARVTGIDERVMSGLLSPLEISVANRMKWAALRETTRIEDMAYCLMGIFNVNMPLLYGEGRRAFVRLQEEILKETDDQSLFAWTASPSEMQDPDELHGLLAASPAQFASTGLIRPLPPLQTQDSVPSSITNQGLRVHLYLRPSVHTDYPSMAAEEEYLAILDCSVREHGVDRFPTIFVRKLWGDQFARIRARECLLLDDPKEDHAGPREGYQTVYIRQNPRYILPEFTVRSKRHLDGPGAGDDDLYQVKEVYPSQYWDPHSLVLTSKTAHGIRALAVLRFHNRNVGGSEVDVAVGLSRVQGRWQAWSLQFPPDEKGLREAYRRINRTLPDLGGDGGSQYLPTTATVQETRRHGRPYILLEVLGKPEIGGSVEISAIADVGIPSSIAVDIQQELVDGLKSLLGSATIPDSLEVSLFPLRGLPPKVRVNNTELETPVARDAFSTALETLESPQFEQVLKLCTSAALVSEDIHDNLNSLIKKDGDVIYHRCAEFHGFQMLHFAAAFGNLSLIDELIESYRQKDLIGTTGNTWTIAHIVAILSGEDCLHVLERIIARLRPNLRERLLGRPCAGTLETPLHFAAAYAPPSAAAKLISLLLNRSENDDINVGQRSLRGRNALDEIPLHRACAMGNLEAVRTLMKFAPDSINDLDKFGRSTIWHAAVGGHAGIIRLLVRRSQLINLGDDEGRTPLHAACLAGRRHAVEALLDLRANANAETRLIGLTPLHIAALYGYAECVQLLIDAGAGLNRMTTASDHVSVGAIHLAAANGHADCVDALLRAGHDAYLKCSHYILLDKETREPALMAAKGQTAEEVAVARGHRDVVSRIKGSAEVTYDWGTGLWRRVSLLGGEAWDSSR